MKIKRQEKEVTFMFEGEEIKLTLRKLTYGEHQHIQKTCMKLKDNVGLKEMKNISTSSMEIDMFRLPVLTNVATIKTWNIEADESTPENPIYLPVNEDNYNKLDENLVNMIAKEIEAFSGNKEAEIKN